MESQIEDLQRVRISLENCEYRGEGNANLVVRLIQENKVLRLVKNCDKNGIFMSSQDVEEKLISYVCYVKDVIQPLIGNFIRDPEIVRLLAEDVRTINEVCENKRPAIRCHRWIRETPTLAILLPDFCTIPNQLSSGKYKKSVTLAIEIKPKQGFISNYNTKDYFVCRYCLKQNVKIESGSIKHKSGYCPLDLFSGCPTRMSHAMRELLMCPQNNLKIFMDQKVILSEEDEVDHLVYSLCSFFKVKDNCESSKEELIHLVIQALLTEYERQSTLPKSLTTNAKEVCENFPGVKCLSGEKCPHYLPDSCVLNRVLQVQKLGQSEVELVNSFIKASEMDGSCIKSDLYLRGCYPNCTLPKNIGVQNADYMESISEFRSRKIWEFLVSMTAKDCSVMLVYQNLEDGDPETVCNIVRDTKGNSYFLSVAVVDLDPKSVHRIEGNLPKAHPEDSAIISTGKKNLLSLVLILRYYPVSFLYSDIYMDF